MKTFKEIETEIAEEKQEALAEDVKSVLQVIDQEIAKRILWAARRQAQVEALRGQRGLLASHVDAGNAEGVAAVLNEVRKVTTEYGRTIIEK